MSKLPVQAEDPADRMLLSAQLRIITRGLPDVRRDLVDRAKDQIRKGTLDTEGRRRAAARLLAEAEFPDS